MTDADLIREIVEEDGERHLVYRNIKRDQLFILSRSKVLNSAELSAGRRLQELREKASIGPLRSRPMDRIFQDKDQLQGHKDAVGGVMRHFHRILSIRAMMKKKNWRIVCLVCFGQTTHAELVEALKETPRHRIGPVVQAAFEELANVIDRY